LKRAENLIQPRVLGLQFLPDLIPGKVVILNPSFFLVGSPLDQVLLIKGDTVIEFFIHVRQLLGKEVTSGERVVHDLFGGSFVFLSCISGGHYLYPS